jgi:hypothetical protein
MVVVVFRRATTFLFPSKLFRKEVKSSLNGVAAAAGKIGAHHHTRTPCHAATYYRTEDRALPSPATHGLTAR